jgi:cytochrome c553
VSRLFQRAGHTTRRHSVLVLIALVAQVMVAGAGLRPAYGADTATPDPEKLAALRAVGQRIYREGILPSGEPLVAMGAAQTRLTGKDAACATCHRRSGHGTTEGRFAIRPITAAALLQEDTVTVHSPRIKAQLGTRTRPPYTSELLARAIRGGVDAANKPLDTLMPRYALSDEHMQALSTYLFSLSAQNSPGVDEQEIHFATVIQPDVSPAQRRAMLDIMQAFVKDKDANARSEEQRRQAGTMRMYRAYRKWSLHVWELKGPSETWGAQLEAFYKEQPVFALVGGLGGAGWRPIHEFSERFEIPAVFPQVDLPVVSGPNQYTFYFSKGVTLEAEVLAKYLREQSLSGSVVQVYRRDGAGATAAAALRASLAAGAPTVLDDRVVEGRADETFWRALLASKPAAIILWLGAQDVAQPPLPAGSEWPPIYLSSSLLGSRRVESGAAAGWNARLVYPSDLSPKHETRLLRNKLWMHNKGIPVTDETVQVNTQFAMTVVSDVVGHMADSFSRDLFVERVEHVVGQTPAASFFPQVSLGPGQRFAAKGGSIVQLLDGDKAGAKAISGWIVP